MNRILFSSAEISGGRAVVSDERAAHILEFLHGEVGQTVKTGELDGKIGTGRIVAIDGGAVTLELSHEQSSLQPWVDLVLAPPRPRAFKRMLPQLAQMGVGRIFLVGAKKVEKDFWGATILKKENYLPVLIEGLMQAGTTPVPVIETRRNFRKFVQEELDSLCPSPWRVVAHPYPPRDGAAGGGTGVPSSAEGARLVLAVGPEGGWTDEEVELMESHGFLRFSLGGRILRTDTAVVALLARLSPEIDAP